RPVNLTVGPDGALYVVDMYRAVIEHPKWMPPELKNRPDLLWGVDRGRIFRVVRYDTPGGRPVLQKSLGRLALTDLVGLLSHPNAWQRDTAHRLLLERLSDRSEPSVVSQLAAAVTGASIPEGRARAICLLDGLGQLDVATLEAAFNDDDPRVVALAVRMAGE